MLNHFWSVPNIVNMLLNIVLVFLLVAGLQGQEILDVEAVESRG